VAEVIWTEPALADLDAIADYIALDNRDAARRLVQRVFDHVDQLRAHPDSGSRPRELRGRRYRQIVEPPCRVFHRVQGNRVYVVHVMRSEQRLRRRPAAAAMTLALLAGPRPRARYRASSSSRWRRA
jgi:plasmid stabilization system protein ParE